MSLPRIISGRYARFNYQGGTLDKTRLVLITEADSLNIRGYDVDQDGHRTFQKSKITDFQYVDTTTIETLEDIGRALGPTAFDELMTLATPLLLRRYAAVRPHDGAYLLAKKQPGVRLLKRELRIGGKTITFNKEGVPTSGGRVVESVDDFLKEVASGTTGR